MAWFDLDQLKLSGTLCTEIGKSDRSEMGQSGKNSVRVYVFRCAHKLGHCLTELARRVCANNGHSGKPTKRLSLYVTSEQATRSSHSASSAITNEMFAKEPNDARVSRLCGELRLARIPPSAKLFSMTAAPPAPSAWHSSVENGLSPSFNFFSVWTVRRCATSVEECIKKAPQKRGAYSQGL